MFRKLFDNPRVINKQIPNIIPKELEKQMRESNRKKVEDIAENINPTLGKVARNYYNMHDTVDNYCDSRDNAIWRKLFSKEITDLKKADHLFVQRIGYTHHGMYIGDGKVIHYLMECVRIDTIEVFADGSKIHRKEKYDSPINHSIEEVINRAYSRLGEDKYFLLNNNCENFVRWCRNGGEEHSHV